MTRALLAAAAVALLLAPACRRSVRPPSATPVVTAGGFSKPESARFDPDQNIYFVSNINGDGNAHDNNGFISRVKADGSIENLRFIAGGTGGVTLNSPNGLVLHGDTLWVVDLDAVRASIATPARRSRPSISRRCVRVFSTTRPSVATAPST